MQDRNIFGCKIYSESIFLGLNLTLHTHSPAYKYSKYPPGDVTSVFVQADFLAGSLKKSALTSRGKNLSVLTKLKKFPGHKFESI